MVKNLTWRYKNHQIHAAADKIIKERTWKLRNENYKGMFEISDTLKSKANQILAMDVTQLRKALN